MARDGPRVFCALLQKIIPTEVKAEVNVTDKLIDAIQEEGRRREVVVTTLTKTATSADDFLIEDIVEFCADPLGFVRYRFFLGVKVSLPAARPDAWASRFSQ